MRRLKSTDAWILDRPFPPEDVLNVCSDSSVVLRSRRFVVSSGFKCQSNAVDAESLARRLRSVVKHVTQMSVALANKDTQMWWASKSPKLYLKSSKELLVGEISRPLTFLQRTSVPALPRLLSGRRMMEVWLSSGPHVPWASINDGQPVPESYLASELLGVEAEPFQQRASTLLNINNNENTPEKGSVAAHTMVHPHFWVVKVDPAERLRVKEERFFLQDHDNKLLIIMFPSLELWPL